MKTLISLLFLTFSFSSFALPEYVTLVNPSFQGQPIRARHEYDADFISEVPAHMVCRLAGFARAKIGRGGHGASYKTGYMSKATKVANIESLFYTDKNSRMNFYAVNSPSFDELDMIVGDGLKDSLNPKISALKEQPCQPVFKEIICEMNKEIKWQREMGKMLESFHSSTEKKYFVYSSSELQIVEGKGCHSYY